MSKRAACRQYVENANSLLLKLDIEMIHLEEELRSPEPLSREGVREVLRNLEGLTWGLGEQLKYARKLEGIPLYASGG